ncbi:MAG: GMC family oxidoreductase [Nitrospira sp.]|uniref:Glucose-methanol-choline (GMC) oxidoreductase:NAD binding site n=1 Tax=Nitrospira defluvii TaxID=330214 RepID=A0ABM8RR71_9BACT|nr:GMC family oxidoreductase [Nitrospira defluvii]MCS6325895.1 GMC family oxidoreductase [Nitrospira sp.]CAE6766944.1 Glucose-methanol-choline (GMC) oxidoreductase:NAD binding site [Nitrospira defluvii]
MLLDANTVSEGHTLSADICIVGAGAAGITLAMELRATGQRIILLEAGGKTRAGESQSLYQGALNDSIRHVPLDQARYRQLGGTTSLWGGRCIPFDSLDFDRREWVPHSGWPFPQKDMHDYYRRAHVYCECGEYDYQVATALPGAHPSMLPSFEDGVVCTSGIERWSPPTQFGKAYRADLAGAEQVRVMLHAPVVELQASSDGTRIESVQVATFAGRRFQVRARIIVLAGGGLETTRLLLASRRVYRDGIGNHSDWLGRGYMSHIHGVIASITLTAGQEVMFGYEADPQGVFCRRRIGFSEAAQRRHELLNLYMLLDRPLLGDPDHGNAVLSATFLLKRLLGGRQQEELGTGKYALYWRHLKNILMGSPQALSVLPKFGRKRLLQRRRIPSLLMRSRSNTYYLYFQSEQIPHRDNRVTLDDVQDELGMPRLRLNFQVTEQDRASVQRAHKLLDEELRRQDCGYLTYLGDDVSQLMGDVKAVLGHHIGTTRMSADPSLGVVDEQGRVHGIANLFVASSSVFPTSSHANPTLTIVAMALRVADHLKGTHSGLM